MICTLGIGWLLWALATSGKGRTPVKKLLSLTVQQRDHMSIDHNDLLRHAYSTCRPHYEALFAHHLVA